MAPSSNKVEYWRGCLYLGIWYSWQMRNLGFTRAMLVLIHPAALLLACNGGPGSPGDSDTDFAMTLAGTIAGQEWAANAGYTDTFPKNDDSFWVIILGGGDEGSCSSPNDTLAAAKLRLRVPANVGAYSLGTTETSELNVFIPPSESFSVATGSLEVTEATSASVRAELSVSDPDQGIEVAGAFTAEICP